MTDNNEGGEKPENAIQGPPFGTVAQIIALLEPLTSSDREHVLQTIAHWFRVGLAQPTLTQPTSKPDRVLLGGPRGEDEKFSNRSVMSVKDFIFEKNPQTDPERMACLGYYLTHYLETPHFKTQDLIRLNAEAAQRTFSNPHFAQSNAYRDGFFVAAPKAGHKQLSAMGERFVHALPDRAAAEQVRNRMKVRRGRKKADGSESDETEG